MIFARLALEEEEDIFVTMAVANLEETMPGEPYDTDMIREQFRRYIASANPTIIVAESRRKVVGFVMSRIAAFDYRAGFFTTQRILYVSPENRGTRAAVVLMKELIRWSRSIGAVRIEGGNENEFQSERTARFLEHFDFKRKGFLLRLELETGNGQE